MGFASYSGTQGGWGHDGFMPGPLVVLRSSWEAQVHGAVSSDRDGGRRRASGGAPEGRVGDRVGAGIEN